MKIVETPGLTRIARAPEGVDALVIAEWLLAHDSLIIVARDDRRLAALASQVGFFAPQADVMALPAWDCTPYDFIDPHTDLVAARMSSLCTLATEHGTESGGVHKDRRPRVLITTISAFVQRVPPPASLNEARIKLEVGGNLSLQHTASFLAGHGYRRVETVREVGEYAPRGGLLDVFAPGMATPVRLDFFGDHLESVRLFDPVSQRSSGTGIQAVPTVVPAREFPFNAAAIERFRSAYRSLFGTDGGRDMLYDAVSDGRELPGLAHWSPLFHESMATLTDYLPQAVLVLDADFDQMFTAKLDDIGARWQTRVDEDSHESGGETLRRRPLPPSCLYMPASDIDELLASKRRLALTPYALPDDGNTIDAGGHIGTDFAAAHAAHGPGAAPAAAVAAIKQAHRAGHSVVVSARDPKGCARLRAMLDLSLVTCNDWASCLQQGGATALTVLDIDRGFTRNDLTFITESDIFGARPPRPVHRRARAEDLIAEASSLEVGDLLVHIEHGIGRYCGLETLHAGGAAHDCLALVYDNDDKLYVPVENIDLLSSYGSSDGLAKLDRLGGVSWQSRKARVKNRLRDMADELIRVAAARAAVPGDPMPASDGPFSAFCARFPYAETEDQDAAIRDVLTDMAGDKPMDRLVCGDVGFGKTEVALRAACVAVENGYQVAVVVPTTLLCRQHAQTFRQRFAGLPVTIGVLSRLTAAKDKAGVHAGLASGDMSIVIGTHALLAKTVTFSNLGLVVIDEEQHFGVRQKERLKSLRNKVHVLTLSATPIPRTLQLCVAGVRDMSLMTSPPVNRLAVRTFVLPRDRVVIGEALKREKARGGQSFYVCPRVKDLAKVEARLRQWVPDMTWRTVHGGMKSDELEQVMTDFQAARFDILLSTAIIESGLDLPIANTMIVERADMFGLAQLYQLRGRIGRSQCRGYAYFILPPVGGITPQAEKRLQILHQLDSLGAGFTLANYDLDIRGAGNLLGGEQSGHIREVGTELYQHLLEEAVAEAKGEDITCNEDWSPQLNIGVPVMIPDDYVPELGTRLSLYRRLGRLQDMQDIEGFAQELEDRFGSLPNSVVNLINVMLVKRLCFAAGITRLDAGPKGATITFRNNDFINPAGLIDHMATQAARFSLRPDHTLVVRGDWASAQKRLNGVREIATTLSTIAAAPHQGGQGHQP